MTTDPMEPEFILNVNDGKDTLHDPHKLTESCNTDDIKGRKVVDEITAESLYARGDAALCQHCKPDVRVEL